MSDELDAPRAQAPCPALTMWAVPARRSTRTGFPVANSPCSASPTSISVWSSGGSGRCGRGGSAPARCSRRSGKATAVAPTASARRSPTTSAAATGGAFSTAPSNWPRSKRVRCSLDRRYAYAACPARRSRSTAHRRHPSPGHRRQCMRGQRRPQRRRWQIRAAVEHGNHERACRMRWRPISAPDTIRPHGHRRRAHPRRTADRRPCRRAQEDRQPASAHRGPPRPERARHALQLLGELDLQLLVQVALDTLIDDYVSDPGLALQDRRAVRGQRQPDDHID